MRVDDWRIRYEEVIDAIRARPFEWGKADCLSGLVVPVLCAITDDDNWFVRFIDRYKTARGALGVMHRTGFKNLADLVASELPEIHPSACRVGDIVAIPCNDEFGFALGVVNGDRAFVLLEKSLGHRDMSEVTRAFKVI